MAMLFSIAVIIFLIIALIRLGELECLLKAKYTEKFTSNMSDSAIQNISGMYNNAGTLSVPSLHITGDVTIDNVLTAGTATVGTLNAKGATTVGEFHAGTATLASLTTPALTNPGITGVNKFVKLMGSMPSMGFGVGGLSFM